MPLPVLVPAYDPKMMGGAVLPRHGRLNFEPLVADEYRVGGVGVREPISKGIVQGTADGQRDPPATEILLREEVPGASPPEEFAQPLAGHHNKKRSGVDRVLLGNLQYAPEMYLYEALKLDEGLWKNNRIVVLLLRRSPPHNSCGSAHPTGMLIQLAILLLLPGPPPSRQPFNGLLIRWAIDKTSKIGPAHFRARR